MSILSGENVKASDRHTWRYLVAGVAIWFLYFTTVYPMTSLACNWGWFPYTIAGVPGLRVVQIVVTLVALVLVAIVIYLPWRNWRQLHAAQSDAIEAAGLNRHLFAAFVTAIVNGFFLLFVLTSFVPILVLNPCH